MSQPAVKASRASADSGSDTETTDREAQSQPAFENADNLSTSSNIESSVEERSEKPCERGDTSDADANGDSASEDSDLSLDSIVKVEASPSVDPSSELKFNVDVTSPPPLPETNAPTTSLESHNKELIDKESPSPSQIDVSSLNTGPEEESHPTCSPEDQESATFSPDDIIAVNVNKPTDIEKNPEPVSSDCKLSFQFNPVHASEPASGITDDSPLTADDKDPALVIVEVPNVEELSPAPAYPDATSELPNPENNPELPTKAKELALTVPDSTLPVGDRTTNVNGSAQLAPDSPDCSQLSAEGDDSTPLLTSSKGNETGPAVTALTASSAPANNNNNARLRLRQRLQQVKIPIPEQNCLNSKRMATSLEDITSLRLWKGIMAEFVGVLLLVLVGCGSCLPLEEGASSSVVQISLCFGLSVATLVWNIGHISGGHINPAVTLALLATRKISLAKAIFFVLFQLVGAVVGAGILMGLTPEQHQGSLGATLVDDDLDPGKGLVVEMFITFVLVLTVFASIDSKRKDLNGSTPLTIGLSVTMCHLFAVPYTGASMNTARSFGPALVTGNWTNHWVYWVGPIAGGVLAGLLYEYLFAVNASLTKVRACVLSSDYDDDKFQAKKIKVRIVEEDENGDENDDDDNDDDGKTGREKSTRGNLSAETLPLTRSEEKASPLEAV